VEKPKTEENPSGKKGTEENQTKR